MKKQTLGCQHLIKINTIITFQFQHTDVNLVSETFTTKSNQFIS